jgi:hypothetical protein
MNVAGLLLEGEMVLRCDCGVPTRIAIRIKFPSSYPNDEPIAYDAAGRFTPSDDRHILAGGRFCLWLPPRSLWDKTDPTRLVRFLDEVAVFLERQLTYDITGIWPGGQYKHCGAGYEEFMLSELGSDEALLRSLLPVILGRVRRGRNEVCPCGSNRKYKRCHLFVVQNISARIGSKTLQRLYNSKTRSSAAPQLN